MLTHTQIRAQFRDIPELPFFARLRNPRTHLTDVERLHHKHLAAGRLFEVVDIALDRDLQHPGLWFKPSNSNGLWLSADWCVIYSSLLLN